MDEPASALSSRETAVLLSLIDELRANGIAIIYISHNIDEVLKTADTITILRDGRMAGSGLASTIDRNQLIAKMVGRDLGVIFQKRNSIPGNMVVEVSRLTGEKFRDINFNVRQGEILGIAGLMGSGRTEIINAIFGIGKITSGTVQIAGKITRIRSPRDAISKRLGLVTEDRKQDGLMMNMSVKKNISMASLKKMSRWQLLNLKMENRIAGEEIRKFNIKVGSMNAPVATLSGGNQQKVVIAKVLLSDPDIIIFDEPTRGIDIGAKAAIYQLMTELAEQGKAIIMVSSELPEILGMSDRILVIHAGTLKAELPCAGASQDLIMQKIMS
jgi:ABC-type sugar transport system ATPase subunit